MESISTFTKGKEKIGTILLIPITGVVIIIALATCLSVFGLPNVFRLYVVQSGSMAPTIPAGSLAIVSTNETVTKSVKEDDVITFLTPNERKRPVTHRIVGATNGNYLTKGDANLSKDGWEVDRNDVLGKELFSIPFLGYPIAFAKTLPGFIILILIPAFYVIISEALVIKRELAKRPVKGGA